MPDLIPCSVQVLTRNSMPGIQRCLESLTAFEEVIVQDGGSTDGTRELARTFANVRLMDQDPRFLNDEGRITDFAAVRNHGLAAARHPWILFVDSDEEIGSDLAEEVREIVKRGEPQVYRAFRRFYVQGQKIERCAGYPAYQIRLFHLSCVDGFGKAVHEKLTLHDGVIPIVLQSEIIVPLLPARELEEKYRRYLDMEVRRLGVMPWPRWLRWILFRNLRSALGLTVKTALIWCTPGSGVRMPVTYEWQSIAHALKTTLYTFPPLARRGAGPSVLRFGRYVFSGVVANILDIGVYLLLLFSGVYYLTATVMSGVLSFLAAFLLHKHVSFQRTDAGVSHFLRYCLLGAGNIVAQAVILWLLVGQWGMPADWTKLLANLMVILWNYVLYQRFVYR